MASESSLCSWRLSDVGRGAGLSWVEERRVDGIVGFEAFILIINVRDSFISVVFLGIVSLAATQGNKVTRGTTHVLCAS